MVLVFAHRGAESIAPENTEAAFKTALEHGARAIELDVQLTKDDVPVVVHDYKLKRYNKDAKLAVNQYTFDELQKIDVGSYFDKQFAGAKIPSLENILQFIPEDIIINIEIKNSPVAHKGIEPKVAALAAQHHNLDNIIVSSFDHTALLKISKCNPDIKLGFLMHYPMINAGRYVSMTGLNAVSVHPFKKITDAAFIEECHKYGLKVYPYTVKNQKEKDRLIKLGADGVFTSLETLY
ncbi:Glycerophosphoryl diester phosphodiesterase [Jeotgalicoccus saudimassiliensis]|uniref:Glycerophosphoryl diester phosphodiesterase n=1 Tax=Jeotgalicoccus saudimassiliensis TaxID=1461582 RepID=A0A078LYX9_9STAP|nr:phosphatidylinositol-specific phospholipase C domain-containing protein [Jeotgalicoccus saudimassiliensis]CDZ99259.1 Glycerophosphoryl diester phosphodiesterase [Jeotgalicoccus saudimassiliensis]